MAKTKKPETSVELDIDGQGLVVPPGEESPVLPLPPGISTESCRSCKYWNRMQSSDWGECRRRLLNVLIPNRLTKYGPEGTFLVTPSHLWCGDYSEKS